MYKPAHHWLWDFWLAHDGQRHHLFYLQAPDDLPDAEQRHANARIGHAVSDDLVTWTELGQVLGPDMDGTWDDRCTWTGSVIASHDCGQANFAMLYTGTNRREGSRIQRVGLAWSDDLHTWQRHNPSLVLEHDAMHYLGCNPAHDDEQAWRDPHVDYCAQRQIYRALTTAQVRGRPPNTEQTDCDSMADPVMVDGYGCIAQSESSDLMQWRVLPPVYQSPAFFLMEIPQWVTINGHHYILFSAMAQWVKPQYLPSEFHSMEPLTGTYYIHSTHADGPWHFGGRLCGHHDTMEYGFKLVSRQGEWLGLFWRGYAANGQFLGDLSDPQPVTQATDGRLLVGPTALTSHG